jgi:sulfatase maturation enzyme AslB (radical SAM superfamily)
MTSHLVVGYSSDTSVYVEVDDEISSCLNVVGGRESSSVNLTSHSSSEHWEDEDVPNFCQCSNSDKEVLVECPNCGSFYELGTHCPWLLE